MAMGRRKSLNKSDLRVFVEVYVETAIWSTADAKTSAFLDELGFGPYDFSTAAVQQIRADCKYFIATYGAYFDDDRYLADFDNDDESAFVQAAHDFWLTRNGHGPGFYDGDWREPAAKVLTDAATRMGAFDIEIGDDGKLHLQRSSSCEEGPHIPRKKRRQVRARTNPPGAHTR